MIIIELCATAILVALTGLIVVKSVHIGLSLWEQCLTLRVRIAKIRSQLTELKRPEPPRRSRGGNVPRNTP